MDTKPLGLKDPNQLMSRIAVNSTRTNLPSNAVKQFVSVFTHNPECPLSIDEIKVALKKFTFILLDTNAKVAIVLAILNTKFPTVTSRNFEFRVAAKVLGVKEQHVRMFVKFVTNNA